MSLFPPPPDSAAGKLEQRAEGLARELETARIHLVLAESCTAGLVAGVLGGVPGISRWLCGSAVVYQEETKQNWLAVPRALISQWGTVAAPVSEILAQNVLDRTPQADMAVAVTGHLGPNAPANLDGLVYIAILFRKGHCQSTECHLPVGTGTTAQKRRFRQRLCTSLVLERIQAACKEILDERASPAS